MAESSKEPQLGLSRNLSELMKEDDDGLFDDPDTPRAPTPRQQQPVETGVPPPPPPESDKEGDTNGNTGSQPETDKASGGDKTRGGTIFFVMKSLDFDDVARSIQKNVWATQSRIETQLNNAFHAYDRVILIFSVNGSHHFQGYGKMLSPVGSEPSEQWTQHLTNPLNDNLQVKICRDGQELPLDIGRQLCAMLMEGFENEKKIRREQGEEWDPFKSRAPVEEASKDDLSMADQGGYGKGKGGDSSGKGKGDDGYGKGKGGDGYGKGKGGDGYGKGKGDDGYGKGKGDSYGKGKGDDGYGKGKGGGYGKGGDGYGKGGDGYGKGGGGYGKGGGGYGKGGDGYGKGGGGYGGDYGKGNGGGKGDGYYGKGGNSYGYGYGKGGYDDYWDYSNQWNDYSGYNGYWDGKGKGGKGYGKGFDGGWNDDDARWNKRGQSPSRGDRRDRSRSRSPKRKLSTEELEMTYEEYLAAFQEKKQKTAEEKTTESGNKKEE